MPKLSLFARSTHTQSPGSAWHLRGLEEHLEFGPIIWDQINSGTAAAELVSWDNIIQGDPDSLALVYASSGSDWVHYTTPREPTTIRSIRLARSAAQAWPRVTAQSAREVRKDIVAIAQALGNVYLLCYEDSRTVGSDSWTIAKLALDQQSGLEPAVSYCPVANAPAPRTAAISFAAVYLGAAHGTSLLLGLPGAPLMAAKYSLNQRLVFQTIAPKTRPRDGAAPIVLAVDDVPPVEIVCMGMEDLRCHELKLAATASAKAIHGSLDLPSPVVSASWFRSSPPPGAPATHVRMLLAAMPALGQVWTMTDYDEFANLPLIGAASRSPQPHAQRGDSTHDLLQIKLPPFDTVCGVKDVGVLVGKRGTRNWHMLTLPSLSIIAATHTKTEFQRS